MKSRPLQDLTTERPNPASADLDLKTGIEIARIINDEDAKVAGAVRRALPQIGRAIDLVASRFRKGGRLIYVGTGTSGRIGATKSVARSNCGCPISITSLSSVPKCLFATTVGQIFNPSGWRTD